MSDENERVPEPEISEDSKSFDFNALTVETTEPLTAFEPPNPRASRERRKWYQRKDKGTNTPREKVPAPPMPKGGIAAPMAALYRKTGELIQPFDYGCGSVLIGGAEDCGKAWEELAKRNPAVRRFLLSLLSTSAVTELLIAHAPILAAVAVHHVPAVRSMMEKMAADAGEMFARMAADGFPEDGAK